MVFLLGINFDERLLVRKALTSLYGISQTSSTFLSQRAPSSLPILNAAASRPLNAQPPTSQKQPEQQSQPQAQQQAQHPPSAARHNTLARLMATHHIHANARLREIPEPTLVALTASLAELTIEGELRRKVVQNIARLRGMNCYRGRRHAFNLPVRGQRTRTQIATARKLNRLDRRG